MSDQKNRILNPSSGGVLDRIRLRPALFLDRDGVINVERGYVHCIENFEFMDGIFELCRHAKKAGMAIVVITNQAGIGRGYYTEEQFVLLTKWMWMQFEKRECSLDGVYYCPFHPMHGIGEFRRESFDRKPNPGMILRAQSDLGLLLERSVFVGDKLSDMQAAKAAGVGMSILIGRSLPDYEKSSEEFFHIDHLREAAKLFLKN